MRKITVHRSYTCYTNSNQSLSLWEEVIMLFLTAGVVIITTLIGSLISVELLES
ncbi:hypothetical protein [Lysinibacillus macroides]|uniref:hypothetical protein n=1 Tax=Lysinibacillus macroides TaxID=33935 RepID=UPI000AC7D247|nr:hypothetical protein [Lysinibacillus macroides]